MALRILELKEKKNTVSYKTNIKPGKVSQKKVDAIFFAFKIFSNLKQFCLMSCLHMSFLSRMTHPLADTSGNDTNWLPVTM